MKAKRLLGGRFRLLENIARGGQGTVWLAEDTTLRREVALKQLVEPAGRGLSRHRDYAMREAHALARVNHHNVVTIHDVFEVDEEPWLVMQYVLGKPLSKILLAGPLDERQVAAVALPVLQGLNAAHRKGVIHRDVKPHNILVGNDHEIVLVDFGTAHVAGFPSLTDPGFLVCTPEFTAPERFAERGDASQAISSATDLWSLGVTMFCAIEGFSPFRRSGEHAGLMTMNAILSGKLPPMVRAGALAVLIAGLLSTDPADRPDALETERVLTAALHATRHVEVPLSRPRPAAGWPDPGPSPSAPAGPAARLGPSAGPASAPAIISGLSDGAATAWLLNLPLEQAATALRALGADRDRIFRQIAEVRPDVAAEILAVWTEAEAGLALGRLPPPLVARVLEAIIRQSPAGDVEDAMRAIRQVSRLAVIAAALERMPQPLAVAILARIADDRAIAVLQQVDPATVRHLEAASPAIVGKLLRRTRSSFQEQVARHTLV